VIKLAVKRPVFTVVVFAILLLAGFLSLTSLPLDLYPDITLPSISLITFYPGASTEEVEAQVVDPLEEAVSTIPDIKGIQSISQENVGAVIIEFEWGKNLDAATNDVRDKIDLAKMDFPEGVEEPMLWKFDVTMIPIVIIGAVSDDPTVDLKKVVEDRIAERLRKIEGVAAVPIWGGGKIRQVNIDVSKTKLDGYSLNLGQILNVLQSENVNVPAGSMELGKYKYLVRVPGEFADVKQIAEIPIATRMGSILRLRDVATVEDGYADQNNFVRIKGKDGVFFAINKRSGGNTVAVAQKVQAELERIEEDIPGVDLVVIRDLSDFISRSVSNLTRTILIAGALVIFITLVLLGNLSASLIIAVTIPVSLIVAFIFLYIRGASINIVSLSALAVAMGLVVDNAIVVLENIFHHRQKRETSFESSIFGASEVGQAILASTLTTVAIFVPLLLVRGFVSVLFSQFAFAVPIVLFASLFSATTLTPMLASRFLRMKARSNKSSLSSLGDRLFSMLESVYASLLKWALTHKWVPVVVAIVLFVIGLAGLGAVEKEFFPTTDEGFFEADIQLPLGTNLAITDSVISVIEKLVSERVPEAKVMLADGGESESGFGLIEGASESSSSGNLTVLLVDREKRKRTSEEIAFALTDEVKKFPGLRRGYFSTAGGGGPQMGSQRDLSVEIYGYDIETTDRLAEEIRARLELLPGLIGITVSRESSKPELWVKIDRERAHSYGLSLAQAAGYLRIALLGVEATTLRMAGDEIPVVVRLDKESRQYLHLFDTFLVPTPTGEFIPLGNIAEVATQPGPLSIEHEDKERVVKVEADLRGRPLGAAIKDVTRSLSETSIPRDVRVEIGGTAEQFQESFQTLFLALIVGIVLVYAVMAAQFESFLDPFIIMFAIPFAVTGVFLAFLITRRPLSIMGYVGLIMLTGIVVNNAIVLVDYTNILRRRGKNLMEAILDAGRRRLRPVLMTTFTTVFGLLPLAISRAEGAELWSPLGISVIGGLLFSTMVTLILVPVLYSIFERKAKKRVEM